MSKDVVSEIIIELLKIASLISTDGKTFSIALQSDFTDLEDAVQYYTALHEGTVNYFITSNIKDYKKALPQLPVLTPKQFITLFNKSKTI